MSASAINTMNGLYKMKFRSPRTADTPELDLELTICTTTDQITGFSTVHLTNLPASESREVSVNPTPLHIDVQSHLTGTLSYDIFAPPTPENVRLDLTGYPIINWPSAGGKGPVVLPNFKAVVILDARFTRGFVRYEVTPVGGFSARPGPWYKYFSEIVRLDREVV
jgi:hypothetical protein